MGNWKLTPAVVFLKTSAVWFHRSSFDTIENPLASSRYGIVAPVGRRDVDQLLEVVADTADRRLSEVTSIRDG
jgi:hypothetical protein